MTQSRSNGYDTTYRHPTVQANPVALELRLQVSGVERSMDNARLWGSPGQLVRQKHAADLGLAIILPEAQVFDTAILVEFNSMRLWTGDVHCD